MHRQLQLPQTPLVLMVCNALLPSSGTYDLVVSRLNSRIQQPPGHWNSVWSMNYTELLIFTPVSEGIIQLASALSTNANRYVADICVHHLHDKLQQNKVKVCKVLGS